MKELEMMTKPRSLRDVVADDAYAASFQSLGQYRTALLEYVETAIQYVGPAIQQAGPAIQYVAPAVQGEPDQARLRERFDEIEREIMENKHTASSVFTQMRTAAFYIAPQPSEHHIADEIPARTTFGGPQRFTVAGQQPAPSAPTFQLGDRVRKTKGSQWKGRVVGTYSTSLTPEGYAVESDTEKGSVQIYPVGALELVGEDAESDVDVLVEALEHGFPLLSDEGLDEVEHHCEWVIQRERKRVHSILAAHRKGGGA